MNDRQKMHNKKPLYEEFTQKQKRVIKKDIELVCSLKDFYFPKTIKELKDRGSFPTTIKVGVAAIRRVYGFIYQSKKYEDLLNFNDIFRAVVLRWNAGLMMVIFLMILNL